MSQLVPGGRVNDVNDVVKRNQPVKVKVLAVAGNRISLSMKEVNQQTGEDLAPRAHRSADVRTRAFACIVFPMFSLKPL